MTGHLQTNACTNTSVANLNSIVDQFEDSWQRKQRDARIEDFLPSKQSPNYTEVLCELIRLDLELRWKNGQQPIVEHYLERFGDTQFDGSQLNQIAFEEYRLQFQAGCYSPPEDYERRLKIDCSHWPRWQPADAPTQRGPQDHHHSFTSPNRNRQAVQNGTSKPPKFPEIGDRFHGFEIVGQLGSGAFGNVYLARQEILANRFVALKVTEESATEPQCLARLQHTNIIPIYSLKKEKKLQSICMPFLGVATMQDLFRQTDQQESRRFSGQELLSSVAGKRASTIVATVDDSKAPELQAELKRSADDQNHEMPAIAGFNYVQTALWLVGRVAGGLAYAHMRGVIHGDLKPGNILISDDGEPLILDFHLSRALHNSGNGRETKIDTLVGGTLPYMSARHLRSLNREEEVDANCDVFSLGVVLYQALTGKLPYEHHGFDDHAIERMVQDRQQLPVSIRQHHPQLPTDINTIVEYCLSPDSNASYQSACEAQTDIERHLQNLPLKHAPNRSIVERSKKWIARHPKLSSATSIAILSLVAIGIVLAAVAGSLSRTAQLEMENHSRQFVSSAELLRVPLMMRHDQYSDRQPEMERASALIQSRLNGDPEHYIQILNQLPQDLRNEEVLELARTEYWLAYRLLEQANVTTDQAEKKHLLEEAFRQLEMATFISSERTPLPILQLKSSVLEAQGKTDAANQLRSSIDSSQHVSTIPERLLQAAELVRNQQDREAIKLLQKLTGEQPDILEAWMMLGRSYSRLKEYDKAEICYTTSIEMDPDLPWGYFDRGVDRLKRGKFELAEADFDSAIERDPAEPISYLNRSLVRRGLNQLDKAVSDLNEAIDKGARETRAYYLRHQLLEQLGKQNQAQADLDVFFRLIPEDEISWLTRGIAHLKQDRTEQALEDFESALKVNQLSIDAYQNIATVHAEYLDQPKAALDALTKISELEPDNLTAVVTRGVLHARLGNRQDAVADAKTVLSKNRNADMLFRAAGIFALSSRMRHKTNDQAIRRQAEQDVRIAIDLLTKASFKDARLVWSRIGDDSDLDSIREEDQFQKLLSIIKSLAGVKE